MNRSFDVVVTEFSIDHNDYRDICAFCAEAEGLLEHNAFVSLMPDIDPAKCILHETDRFVVIPALGAVCDGHVLIVPKRHVLSAGHLDCDHDAELAALMIKLRDYLTEQYRLPVAAFEHGAESFRNRGGSCTDHAHVNFFPALPQVDLVSPVRTEFELRSATDLATSVRAQVVERQRPYLWICEQDEAIWICDAPDALSQYIRRILVTQLGRRDEWDWAVFPGLDSIYATIKRFHDVPMR